LEQTDWDTLCVAPLLFRGTPSGGLNLYFTKNTEPDEDTRSFLRAIAAQAAVGVENARLFAATERTAQENAALAGVAADITLAQPMRETLESVTAHVVGSTEATAASVALLDPATGELTTFGGTGLPVGFVDEARGPITRQMPLR